MWLQLEGNITAYYLLHFINHTDQSKRLIEIIYHESLDNTTISIPT